MDLQIKAHLVKSLEDIQTKFVYVTDKNYILVRKRLEFEKKRAVKILTDMKDKGQIKTISRPKNLTYKNELKNLMAAKKEINKAILQIKEMYYK